MLETEHKYLELFEVGICLFALKEEKKKPQRWGGGGRMYVNVFPHSENKDGSFSPMFFPAPGCKNKHVHNLGVDSV